MNRDSEYKGIVENLRKYNLEKNIKNQLQILNPLLVKKESNLMIHLEKAVENKIITETEKTFLEAKLELGKMCLELEQVLDNIHVSMVFYDRGRNTIFHGACPSVPIDFFDFFGMVNENGLFNDSFASCGRAVFKEEVVQTDIETSPLWSNLKEYALKFGFKSCISIPFYTNTGQLAGTFAHLSHLPNYELTQDEVEMIQEKTIMYSDVIQKISSRLQEFTRMGETGLLI